MKNKYVIKSSFFIDNELTEYFNSMSQKGWKLDFVGFYYKFIPCNCSYKFQIDYTEPTDEYLQILNEYGYEEITCGFDFHVYANRNLQAPDLNTEESLIINSKLKKLPISKSIIFSIAAIILFFLTKACLKDIFLFGKGAYYYNPNNLYLGMFFAIFMILFIVFAIYNLCARRLLKKGIGNLKTLKIITIVKDVLYIFFMIVGCTSILINSVFHNQKLLKEFILCIPFLYLLGQILKKIKSKKLATFIEIVVVFVCLIFPNGDVTKNVSEEKIVIDHFPTDDCIIAEFASSYSKVVEFEHETAFIDITHEPMLSKEYYVECKNEEIAREVFKYIIIKADKDNREIIDLQAFLQDKNRNTWSEDEISFRSYKQALSSFQKINNYYMNNNHVVMLYKNKIIQIYVDDINEIDNILQKFIDFKLP